jgi:transcriptional regulator with XRE-family HTH domain
MKGAGRETQRRPRRTIGADGPDPIDVHVGHRLRQARLLAGLSQDELGTSIGVSFQAVQKYEAGENRISASRLFNAARCLDCSVSFFFDDLIGQATATDLDEISGQAIELVRYFRQITDPQIRDHLLRMTKQIGLLGKATAD